MSEQICLSCTLASCNDKSPDCGLVQIKRVLDAPKPDKHPNRRKGRIPGSGWKQQLKAYWAEQAQRESSI